MTETSPLNGGTQQPEDPAIARGEKALAIVRTFEDRIEALESIAADTNEKTARVLLILTDHINRELQASAAAASAWWTPLAQRAGLVLATILTAALTALAARYGLQ